MSAPAARPRRRLFRKYVVAFVSLVSVVLFAGGGVDTYFQYQDTQAALIALQGEKAHAAASRISLFVDGIQTEIAASFPLPQTSGSPSLAQRRLEYLRLLRQVPAVTEVSYLDGSGHELLRLSRLTIDVVGSETDYSRSPRFLGARSAGVYFSGVYYRDSSEPYMTIAVADADASGGVSVAEVNLKLILDVVSGIKVGSAGYAYVVDKRGELVAHPDLALVLRQTDASGLPQVRSAIDAPLATVATAGRDLAGREVLTAHERIAPLGWIVFVDEPLEEAFAPVYDAVARNLLLLLLGFGLSLLASFVLADTMVRPVRALQQGAARIAAGQLDHRIAIKSGDELEMLANDFNEMSGRLQESHRDLERKVAERTKDLAAVLEALRTSEQRLQTVVSNVPVVLFAVDRSGSFLLAEGKGLAPLGHTAETLVGRPLHELCGERHELCAQVARALAGDEITATVAIGPRPFDVQAAPLRDATGEVIGAIVVAVDVTERLQAEQLMRQQSEVYEPLLKAQSDLGEVIMIGEGEQLLYLNDAFAQITGYARDELGRIASIRELVVPEDRDALREALRHARAGVRLETAILRKNGERVELEVAVEHYRSGDRDRQVVLARDITERKEAQRALEHQALHDLLTALPNRTLLQDRLDQAILAARRGGTALSLLLMDLDRFKEVNDTFGHPTGDVLLREVGRRLAAAVRETDTVARLGGDEFAVLLPGAGADGATRVARNLLKALERPFVIEGQGRGISASIGIAFYPDHGASADALLRNADVAMYVAKRAANGYAVYESEQHQHSADRLALTADLRRALEQGALEVAYQPILDLASGRVAAVEALARWRHERLGPVPPAEFIPLAEQTGLIKPLTEWVLGAALRQRRLWAEQGWDLTVSVNLSVRNLLDAQLPDLVATLLARHAARPEHLALEITESVLMAEPERATGVLSRLRAMGIKLALDDFGTGFSSLTYLRHLPVDLVKIDHSFVMTMTADPSSAAIVRSTVELGHNLGFRVVAEGVETKEAWLALAQLGCDEAQGYYFSRPLPPVELVRWLAESPWAGAAAPAGTR